MIRFHYMLFRCRCRLPRRFADMPLLLMLLLRQLRYALLMLFDAIRYIFMPGATR